MVDEWLPTPCYDEALILKNAAVFYADCHAQLAAVAAARLASPESLAQPIDSFPRALI